MTVTTVTPKYKSGIHYNLETFLLLYAEVKIITNHFAVAQSERRNREIKGVTHTGIHRISACILDSSAF
jgi:hypothetical protein